MGPDRLASRRSPEPQLIPEDGIEVLLGSDTFRGERNGASGIKLRVDTLDGKRDLEGSHLLVATGRVPNTETLERVMNLD